MGLFAFLKSQGNSKSPQTALLSTDDFYLAYQYDDVKFYPPTEITSKVNKKFLKPGTELFLKQEPNNKYDNQAVAIYSNGHKIGYMLRGVLQDMTNNYIENGWPIITALSSLKFVDSEYEGYINLSYYRKSTKPKRLGYNDIDIHAIKATNPDSITNTPICGKNVVFSGFFNLPLEDMMQIAVDAGATLKTRVSKSTDYLVVGKQDPMFLDENGQSSKEATATKLIQQGESHISIINEATFLALVKDVVKA